MSFSQILKISGAVLLICTAPLVASAQRDKSSAKRAAQYRAEQLKRKEEAKQKAAQQAAREAAKKAKQEQQSLARKHKAEAARARKAAKEIVEQEQQLASKPEKPQKVTLVDSQTDNSPPPSPKPTKELLATDKPQQPEKRTLDKIVETDMVPTIDLKTKSNGSTLGNLIALFNEISSSKKSSSQSLLETPKIKVEKGTFEGIKVWRMFIRHASGFVEKFHYVKDFQNPPANIDELYYYNKLTGKITMRNPMEVGMSTFDKENFLLLHGPYIKTKGDQVYEQGSFYLGAKHGRWEKFDKNFVLQEKFYYHKGIARDAEFIYDKDERGREKLKEIVPLQHGLRHGTYIAYFPSGRVAMRGQYAEGCKIGKWTEYYDRDKNPRKRETIYPRRPHDDSSQPYVSREWDESGKLITDVRR
ncbi:MAG: hypothetical protein RMJ87_03055 [Cytophagales bacterium]|nr:hypothetical protein [Bernardetiaceae bacterium]MDW8203985.1 hypothetical protein [Cytophagales bacterium]